MTDDGPLQRSLFDEQDLAEITSEADFPGQRLIACRNPALAAERARKREDLLAATEKALAPVMARVAAGKLAGARLDGICVIRTPLPAAELGAAATVTACKNLKYVERDFRTIKSDDLDLRPVSRRLEKRVRGHVLICMLAAYLTWHLRQAWAPLTYTDEEPPPRPAPSPPRSARHPPRPRHHASTTRPATATAASRACSPTWAP
ncbi:MAG TPA: hypothetical protein VFV73_42760 [Streptosporangiaceae bacterium]|nr:hypothetical protein [Streptosporangiaceae bacterium]